MSCFTLVYAFSQDTKGLSIHTTTHYTSTQVCQVSALVLHFFKRSPKQACSSDSSVMTRRSKFMHV